MKYRYHWLFKLLALVLAAVSGAVLCLGCAGLILDDLGYYERSRRSQQYQDVNNYSNGAANAVFDRFAWKDTGIEPKLFERFFRWGADVDAVDSLEYDFSYTIRGANSSKILEGGAVGENWVWSLGKDYDVRRGSVTVMPKAAVYPAYSEYRQPGQEYLTLDGDPLPPLGEGVTDVEYYVVSESGSVNPQNISTDSYEHAWANGQDYTIYRMEYTGYESYCVEVFMTQEQVDAILGGSLESEFLPKFLSAHHDALGPMTIWGTIVLLLALLWLALTAGGSPYRDGIRPAGLNRLPLDALFCVCALGGILVLRTMIALLDQMVWSSGWGSYDGSLVETFFWDSAHMALMGACGGGAAAVFTMACAAQMKAGCWLKYTCVGFCWHYGRKWGRRLVKFVRDLFMLLPLYWQWLLVTGGLWLLMLVCMIWCAQEGTVVPLFFGVAVTIPVVVYGAWCFAKLRSAAKKMSGGNLNEKIGSRFLLGCFGEFAGHLNTLGDACMEAADQRMRSERMKTELITNVSHDIKTPLTSIINYVDILQKSDDEEQRKACLEVLDRQSQRLKKLIGDLMDMSKASSGNVSVEITPTDVTEAVSQALGEFADPMENRDLTVMFRAPAAPVMALCDGRHLWRVLSNVLSNVVKYALAGTRVYVDLLEGKDRVEVSIRNISAEMLGISAQELMERFVRGDSSRNTEGSGLGLNIAKSLMELQGGSLELVVDGDLFKVVLTLPKA